MPHVPQALTLLSVLLHDMRTPLTDVRWSAELLRDEWKTFSEEKRTQYLNSILDAGTRGVEVTALVTTGTLVLQNAYEAAPELLVRTDELRRACEALAPQFVRHNRTLAVRFEDRTDHEQIDPELVRLLAWSMCKQAILSSTRASTIVATYSSEQSAVGHAGVFAVSFPVSGERDGVDSTTAAAIAVYASLAQAAATALGAEYTHADIAGTRTLRVTFPEAAP